MKYVLFDLDGTLTEPYEGISKSILYALDYYGIAHPSESVLRSCIGPPLYGSFQTLFGMSVEQSYEAVDKFRERYHELGWQENALLEGAEECLRALKSAGKILAVATGKPTVFAKKILEKFGVLSLFSAVVGSELDGTMTKKEEEIEEAMRLIGATAEECVMVGDRKFDVLGARLCGMDCVGLHMGYAEEGELEEAGAIAVFDRFAPLKEYLLSL